MQYLDTSLLVAAFTREAETKRMQAWLAEQVAEQLAVSDWVMTEFSAALSMKLRLNHINVDQRADILASFTRVATESFHVIPVIGNHFKIASRFVDQHTLGLRAGDALHLAIASDLGAAVCTLDRQLAQSGPPLGVKTLLV